MWTTIAEIFDVPAAERVPPPSSTTSGISPVRCFVLDNLEQTRTPPPSFAELLAAATARGAGPLDGPTARPRAHQRQVPPLQLTGDTGDEAGAVQLFVQAARMVRSDFALPPTMLRKWRRSPMSW